MGNIPTFNIGDLELKLIQGGMGIGISGANLARAVSDERGLGVIASVELGALKGYPGKPADANSEAFRDEIRKARELTDGPIGVNIMRALTEYERLVDVAVKEDVDVIITGAGPALKLPKYIPEDSNTKIIPIVRGAREAEKFSKVWKRLGRAPAALIVEGPKAGGHLAYTVEELADPDFVNSFLEKSIGEVAEVAANYGNIPVIAAGGIFYGGDIARALEWGASGVQMGSRFVCTDECDASREFKEAYLASTPEDFVIIKSPVGMPGRALKNDFIDRSHEVRCLYNCLSTCNPKEAPYCIANALISAQRGDLDNGFVFAGTNAYLCKDIVPVSELFERLENEYEAGKMSA